MRILALQLKRIGDLVLTTPALAEIKRLLPDSDLTLAVSDASAPLLSAIESIDAGIVFGVGRGWTPWQQILTGRWDAVLDFTGSERSAAASLLSRAKRRAGYAWTRKKGLRSLAYTELVESPVRDCHTVEHYGRLLDSLGLEADRSAEPRLKLPYSATVSAAEFLARVGVSGPFAVVHPGTARPEKYWNCERWAEVIDHLQRVCGIPCVLTGGPWSYEQEHLGQILASSRFSGGNAPLYASGTGILALAALLQRAAIVLSCDTAALHLAASFGAPQVALFGPTNPFHWRPRHPNGIVISASNPGAPLTEFAPRAKGAPMDRISTETVIRVTEELLSRIPSTRSAVGR